MLHSRLKIKTFNLECLPYPGIAHTITNMRNFPQNISPMLSWLVKAWCTSLDYCLINYGPVHELRKEKIPIIFAIYHNELFPLSYLHRHEGIIAVVSASQDGELLASVLSRLGYGLARGSSSRQGLKAMREAVRKIKQEGRDAVLTVDGPRGPRHKVKPGVIYLASRSRAFIVPVRVRMSTRHVFFKSWDQFRLPWLWSRCEVVYGDPYKLPQGLSAPEINRETEILENKLNFLY